MSKIFVQKLRIAASEADDLLTSCDASDLLDGLEVARDYMFEAANVIDQLESRLAQAELERDAAVHDLAEGRNCEDCKHYYDSVFNEPCSSCIEDEETKKNWQWRGICPEEDPHDR